MCVLCIFSMRSKLLVSKPVNKFSAMHEYDNLFDSISLLHFTFDSTCILSAKDQVSTPI